jgi:hypothetical protein
MTSLAKPTPDTPCEHPEPVAVTSHADPGRVEYCSGCSSLITTVYEPAMWPRLVETGQREELCEWLRANGINPDCVPIHNEISVETSANSTGLIQYTAYLLTADGHKYLDPETDDAAQEQRTVPLVAPPAHW